MVLANCFRNVSGFVTDTFETQRVAYLLSGSLFVFVSMLLFTIGFREICVQKREDIYDVAGRAHANDIDKVICRNQDVDITTIQYTK